MFKKKKQGTEHHSHAAPVTDARYNMAKREWFERMGDPVVDRSRYFVWAVSVTILAIAQTGLIYSLFPLKQVVPYVIRVDASGEAKPDSAASGVATYNPTRAEINYFLGRFVRNLMSADARLTEANLKEAWNFVLGKAATEFTDYINRVKPIEMVRKDPSFSRTVNIRSITPVADRVMMVRVSTEDRTGITAPKTSFWVVTIHYDIVPPSSGEEESILRNPLGLFVTHFEITEEITRQ